MGIVLCTKHGKSGNAHVCSHLRADVLAEKTVREYSAYPLGMEAMEEANLGSYWIIFRACPECVNSRSLPVPPRMITEEEQEGFYKDRLESESVCINCFMEAGGKSDHVDGQ